MESWSENVNLKANRRLDAYLAFVFGVIFVTAMLAISIAIPNPTEKTFFVFRVTLALAAAGIGAVLPGFITVKFGRWIRAGGALGLFVFVYAINPPAIVAPPEDELIRRADSAIAVQEPAAAISLLKEALRLNDKKWAARLSFGRANFQLGDYASALENFKRAAELDESKGWHPYVGIALSAEGLGAFEEAASAYATVLARLPPGEPMTRSTIYDQGRIALLLWLARDAPKDTSLYRVASDHLSKYLNMAGSPVHWGWYLQACLKAKRSEDQAFSGPDRDTLRSAAILDLRRAAEELDRFKGTKAPIQREMFHSLLRNPDSYKQQPGSPIACPALIDLLKIQNVSVDSLVSSR